MKIEKSLYLESRRHDKSTYSRLMKNIRANLKHLGERPNLEITLTMSAKYQTPCVTIRERDKIPEGMGYLESAIIEAIETVGYSYSESSDKGTFYEISFNDNY